MTRIIGIALVTALTTSIGCVLDWPEECDPFVGQPCEDTALICEIVDPQEPTYGYCIAPGGGQCGGPGLFGCDGGESCFPVEFVCDGEIDCRDALDEVNCGPCTPQQFLCPGTSADCRPRSDRCDSVSNCPGD